MNLRRIVGLPFATFYGAILAIRHWLYNRGIKKTAVYNKGVICIGNLSLGGTGKTPFTILVAKQLGDSENVAILSRGYKRKTQGFLMLDDVTTPEEAGDEPVLMRKQLKSTVVAVDSNRKNGIEQLKKMGCRIVILDDAFQHRKVTAGLNILLTDFHNLYSRDCLLPAGNLRDLPGRAKAAQMIVVTKCPRRADEQAIAQSLKLTASQQLYLAEINYNSISSLHGDQEFGPDYLRGKSVVLFSGIAKPDYLLEYVRSQCKECKVIEFPDHHIYGVKDLQQIKELFDNFAVSEKLVLTTAKDAVKLNDQTLSSILLQLPVFVMNIEPVFVRNGENFVRELKTYVGED